MKMRIIQAIIFLIVSVILIFPVSAQDEKPINIETNLVNINVAIADKKGKFVEGLKKENFEIFDDGVKQKLKYFSAEETPISFGIVYDMHPTTSERTKAVLESLREFTKGLRQQDDFFTLVFNKRGSLVTNFVPTSEQVSRHLMGKYRQPNSLYDAIYAATEQISKTRNLKRVLLIITDSADHNSEHKFNDILVRLKTLDAQIYTIIWDEAEKWEYSDVTRNGQPRRVLSDATGLDRAALQDLALRTGGTLQSPTVQNASELYRIYNQIAFEVRKQYTLGFYPEKADGKWHQLKVKLNSVKDSKKMAMTYRLGYQSPKKGK